MAGSVLVLKLGLVSWNGVAYLNPATAYAQMLPIINFQNEEQTHVIFFTDRFAHKPIKIIYDIYNDIFKSKTLAFVPADVWDTNDFSICYDGSNGCKYPERLGFRW